MRAGGANKLFISLLMLALLAAVVCTFCDAMHIYSAALSYPHPVWFGQAGWVFPLFFVAFFILGVAYLLLVKVLADSLQLTTSRRRGNAGLMTESMAMFVMTYLLTGFANSSPALLGAILYSIFLIRLCFTYERRFLLLLAVLLALGGMLTEGVLGAMGWVAYSQQQVFFVPWWLGGLYAHGAFALRESVRALVIPDE